MKLHSQASPLRLLLILEWILLGIVAIAQVWMATLNGVSMLTIANGLGLGTLWLMGRILPQRSLHKLLLLSFEFGLILCMIFWGHIQLFQLLFIVLVIRNCVLLEGRSRSIVTGLTFIAAILGQAHRLYTQGLVVKIAPDQMGIFWVGFFLMFGLIVLFLQLLVDAILSERKSREQLIVANTRLRDYALKVEELATVQERNRIAREIHDSLGHSLTGFNLYLEAALRLLHSDLKEAEDLIVEAKQLGAIALQEVRQSVATLRSDPLQGRSLKESLGSLIEDFHRSTGISPICHLSFKPIPHELQTALYRITQEALTNIRKYAAATEVEICFQCTPNLQLTIRDNGKGFDLSQNITGFGLQGMRERTSALDGTFEIIAALGSGCQIIAQFPLDSSFSVYSNPYDSDSAD
ncbi:sensor histidine kinase [Tumidithrix helvetica]|uniref:sensor histidine kinase n=1 Tax=Tumidithrix helvetica TaxID=3457545 RepID=UPI003CC5F35D